MAYEHTNAKGQKYFLNAKDVKLRSGMTRTIYYFSKDIRPEGMDKLPAGYKVVENKRTGLPVLKKG